MVKRGLGWLYIGCILTFLYAPILVLMVMSFNESRYNALPFRFSTKWYQDLVQNDALIEASLQSITIAVITGIVSVVLATLLLIGLINSDSKLKNWIDSLVILPLTIPWLIIGLSILLLLSALGLDKNYLVLLIGHIVVSLPYAVMVIKARLQSLDLSITEASASLGANDWTTIRRILLPLLYPAMLAGGFLSFIISFDNFMISYFLIPTGLSTLPIEIYASIKFGFTPEVNAVSTIIILLTMSLLIVMAMVMRSSLKNMFK